MLAAVSTSQHFTGSVLSPDTQHDCDYNVLPSILSFSRGGANCNNAVYIAATEYI